MARRIAERARVVSFEITRFFEGGGYGLVAGNYDGQILSVGALQWNVGQGTLFRLVVLSASTDEARFREIFGSHADWVLEAARRRDREAFRAMLRSDGRVDPVWARMWRAWGEAYAELQRVEGAAPYHRLAERIVRHFGFQTMRAYAWAFDIAVQNGGLGERIMREAVSEVSRLCRGGREREALEYVTGLRGELVKKEFRQAYFSRKLAIVRGRGVVNRSFVDVDRRFGLSDESCWEEVG